PRGPVHRDDQAPAGGAHRRGRRGGCSLPLPDEGRLHDGPGALRGRRQRPRGLARLTEPRRRPPVSSAMARLSIRHETFYGYEKPVRFATHRLLVRPRDSDAIRVVEAVLTVSPPGDTHWQYDALGNSVCLFTPRGTSTGLSIVSDLVIERYPS